MKGPRAAASTAEHPQGRVTFSRYSQEGNNAMMNDSPASGNTPSDEVRDAAWNAVAVAALAYHRELNALRVILRSAIQHGLGASDLVYASGLDAGFVSRLLEEVA